MPALTMAAACRYAETGVIATIESGNHAWNGNWADLVNAATATRTATSVVSPDCAPHTSCVRTALIRVVPVATIMTVTAASSTSPPATVTSNVRIAGSRAPSPERAMSRNEHSVVASHAT